MDILKQNLKKMYRYIIYTMYIIHTSIHACIHTYTYSILTDCKYSNSIPITWRMNIRRSTDAKQFECTCLLEKVGDPFYGPLEWIYIGIVPVIGIILYRFIYTKMYSITMQRHIYIDVHWLREIRHGLTGKKLHGRYDGVC